MTWSYLDAETPFGIAHRGGGTVAPENTVAAFADAVQMGYRYLETDVHCTADGVLVATHDPDLARIANDKRRVSDMTWAEVSSIRIDEQHRIPRLIDLLAEFPTARFNIDPKSDTAVEPLITILTQGDVVDRVCIGSFSEARVGRIREAVGHRLCTSPGPTGIAKVLLAALVGWPSVPYGCIQIPVRYKFLWFGRPWIIRRVQALGLQVHFWTVNDEEDMIRLLDAGADAIITDTTRLLLDVLAARR